MSEQLSVTIKRFKPEERAKSYLETFKIPAAEGMTILNALKYIQENLDPTLAFYHSCELARCRGCVVEVKGKIVFACTEPFKDGLTLEPVSNLPVIRDLVVKFIDSRVIVDQELCNGCKACIKRCPMDVYEMAPEGKVVMVRDGAVEGFAGKGDMVDCIGCRKCEQGCPTGAIQIVPLDGPAVV